MGPDFVRDYDVFNGAIGFESFGYVILADIDGQEVHETGFCCMAGDFGGRFSVTHGGPGGCILSLSHFLSLSLSFSLFSLSSST